MKPFHRTGVLLGGALAASAVALAVLPHPQSRPRNSVPPNLNTVSLTLPSQTSDGMDAEDPPTANKLPLAFYQGNVRTGLFNAPQPAPPAPPPPRVVAVKPVQKVQPIALAPPPDRFANYVYSGSVEMNGQIVALIEDSQTKAGWYLQSGDRFEGASVTRIDAQSVTLEVDGKPRVFDKSTVYNVVPLNAAARPDQLNANASGQAVAVQTGSSGANQAVSIQPSTNETAPAASTQPNTNRSGRRGFGGPGGFGGQGGFGGRAFGGAGNFGGQGGPGGPPQ